jgi:hypothetical protein
MIRRISIEMEKREKTTDYHGPTRIKDLNFKPEVREGPGNLWFPWSVVKNSCAFILSSGKHFERRR